jgi:hypothetical protein
MTSFSFDPAWNPPPNLEGADPHAQAFITGPFEPGELPCNVIGGDVGDVTGASFTDDAARPTAPPPPNIVID